MEKMSLEQTDLILRENGMYSEERIERLGLSSLQLKVDLDKTDIRLYMRESRTEYGTKTDIYKFIKTGDELKLVKIIEPKKVLCQIGESSEFLYLDEAHRHLEEIGKMPNLNGVILPNEIKSFIATSNGVVFIEKESTIRDPGTMYFSIPPYNTAKILEGYNGNHFDPREVSKQILQNSKEI